MNITVTGASGLIGRRLLRVLGGAGNSLHVLSRHAGTNLPAGVRLSVWNSLQGPPPLESLRDADAIIHLAGEPVAQRWTTDTRRRIRESRVASTRHLVEGLAALDRRPSVLVSASAVGYYGSRGDELLDETSAPGGDFLAEVCVAWEREAQAAEALGVRVVRIRIGVVLDRRAGALQRMLVPFRLGLGGRLGSGKQWMPWIHLQDLAELFRFAAENSLSGAVNGVAPYPVTNAEFTRELARALHRPALFPVPSLALRLALGEMGEVVLASQRAVPRAAETARFPFQFPQLPAALRAILQEQAVR